MKRTGHAMVILLLAGCATRTPIEIEAVSAPVQKEPQPAAFRRTARLELEGEALSGNFTLVLVGRRNRDGGTELRLQALPEFGPKLLDIVVGHDHVTGFIPATGESVRYSPDDRAAPPLHILTFIAASCLEREAPLAPRRIVRGWRGSHDELILELRGALRSVRVEATLQEGALTRRQYELQGVRWTEDISGTTRSFMAPGMTWRVSELDLESLDHVPDALLELSVPGHLPP
jgi:hypothetical protein